MLSRAGFNRFSPRANLLLMLASNAPDIDLISWIGGTTGHLTYHRWYTHAWVMAPILSLLPVLIARLFTRQGFNWWKAWLISIIGVASHILLDSTNSFGIRSLLPFSPDWRSLDTTFVIDPWIWGILLLAVGAPFISSLVSSEIGGKKSSGQGWAIFALLFVLLYDAGRYAAHDRAIEILSARMFNGETPRRVGAFPEFANPMRWSAVVELPGSYWVSSVNLLEEFDPGAGRIFYKTPFNPEIEAARATEPFRVFMDFTKWQLWRTTPMPSPEGAIKVHLFDLRFGDPVSPGFLAQATVLPGKRVEDPEIRFGGLKLTPREGR